MDKEISYHAVKFEAGEENSLYFESQVFDACLVLHLLNASQLDLFLPFQLSLPNTQSTSSWEPTSGQP